MTSYPYYFCDGDVRGACGHQHKTVEAAIECLERDRRGCRTQGGYSDRNIVRAEDQHKHLIVDEVDFE